MRLMPDSTPSDSAKPAAGQPAAGAAPRRGPGHRADARDTVAELAEKAQLISLEAGSTVAAAMKDVISAAAGIAGFAIESARDLTNYMVRRGQMTQDEADKLLREAEVAHVKRPSSERAKPTATKIAAEKAALVKAQAARAAEIAAAAFAKLHPPRPPKPPSKVFMPKPPKNPRPATRNSATPAASKKPGKNAASKKAGKTPVTKKPAKQPARPTAGRKQASKKSGEPAARQKPAHRSSAGRKPPAKKRR
ncbi:MAG: hypothetical protein ACREN3_03355 [Gemmatimonadaceae bacterium]